MAVPATPTIIRLAVAGTARANAARGPAGPGPSAAALALARLVLAGWDPVKHPRHPKGSPHGGGRFAPKAASGGGGGTPVTKPKVDPPDPPAVPC